MSFRNIRDEGIQRVATAAERLLLLPTDGTVVVQLDNHTLYIYDETTNTWVVLGTGIGGFAFGVVQPDTGTSPTADTLSDTLTLTSSDTSLSIAGNALTDTIDITLSNSGVTAGSYLVTGATIDSKGRVTAATENYYLTIVNALIFG